jgi:hypothetical protein
MNSQSCEKSAITLLARAESLDVVSTLARSSKAALRLTEIAAAVRPKLG